MVVAQERATKARIRPRAPPLCSAAGLLTDRCVMAHAVHLTPAELKRVVALRTGVACCPLSNIFFANGAFPLRRAQAAGYAPFGGVSCAGGGGADGKPTRALARPGKS